MKTNYQLRIANYKLPITNLALPILIALLLSSCSSAPAQPNTNIAMTAAFETAVAQISQPTMAPVFTEIPIPTATIPRTPPALPSVFQTNLLSSLNTPHTYITDSCEYLKNKWTSTNAAPGTIVMVIMFHGVTKDKSNDIKNIWGPDFKKMMNDLHDMGFQAINTQQMADFMYKNAKIPPRSVILIKDDRHTAQDFNDWFRPYWQEWGWPVVNAWIGVDGGKDINLADNVALEKEGWVDHQAHGVIHNIPMGDNSTDAYITSELQGSINIFQQYYGKTPIAIIWPGGGFGVRPVQIARQLGYKLGFTVNPRGPIMFNWIPLADQPDPARPNWIAEGPANDPRLTLPRYWPSQALAQLDTIRAIGNDAATYAQQNKSVELDYYNIVCAPTYGMIP